VPAEDGLAVVGGVLAAAAAATLDGPTAAAAAAVEAAASRDAGADPRPAIILAGLRNPCGQINSFQPGLLKEVLGHDDDGNLVRKAGVMAVVLRGGPIRPGDPVVAEPPPQPHAPLERVLSGAAARAWDDRGGRRIVGILQLKKNGRPCLDRSTPERT
jgi:hypothetical protein